MKFDGARAIARCTGEGVSLWSRNLRDISASYPEVVAALVEITAGRTMLLDGELVAPDDCGAPSFSRLQRRMHVQRPAPALIEQIRVDYLAFDLLALDADNLLDDRPNAATFGGLVLAGHTPDGRLHCIGGVGTGFNTETRRSLRAALEEIQRDTSPAR